MPTGDELAGLVDTFGALTRAELRRAYDEAAFRAGTGDGGEAFDRAIAEARRSYRLVGCPPEAVADPPDGDEGGRENRELLVAGPCAFPDPPAGAEDLPHILDVDRRRVDRTALAAGLQERFRTDTARAVQSGDRDRMTALLDTTYDVETWAPVDLSDVRDRLDDALLAHDDGDSDSNGDEEGNT